MTLPGGSDTLLGRLLLDKTAAALSRPALSHAGTTWTYAELRQSVVATGHALRTLGVGHGDRVMFVLPNSPEFVVSFLAVTALGAIVVPVDFQAGPGRLDFIAADTSPACCLRMESRELHEGFTVPQYGVRLDPGSGGLHVDGAASPPAPEIELAADAGDPAVILFSAGSTGRPKGAVLEHRHLLHIARTLIGIVGIDADHRDLILSPMTHSGGWQRVTSTLLAGGSVVVAEGPISIPGILEDLRDHAIRGFFAAPPILRALLMTRADRVRKAATELRTIESASAPLSPEELARLLELLPDTNVLFQYGLTECSRACILDTRGHPDKLHTVGPPTPGVEVAIAGQDGEAVGPGKQGEVLLAAPQRAERYWNRPDLDRERFCGRWLRTGDVGSVDEAGFLTFHGRRDDVINCGGLSFFPAEVERDLGPVPGVDHYIVAGVPDPKGVLGQVAWIFVVPENPDTWKAATLAARARGRLPPHMIPRKIVTLKSMPFITAGKPDRRRVLAEHGPAATPDS